MGTHNIYIHEEMRKKFSTFVHKSALSRALQLTLSDVLLISFFLTGIQD